ncbi:ShlB/FhaC/HecB family hemolysin secretion/activation protein [Romeriopsis navalis]|nr:ShlB/FhaC/HecB family hemolysin secretion/activation protein [Romeriopsis navalis]
MLNSAWLGTSNSVAMTDIPSSQPLPNERPVKLLRPPTPVTPLTPKTTIDQQLIMVREIKVVDNTILHKAIAQITKSFAGRTVKLQELHEVADQITQLYLDQNYLTSRAVLEAQNIRDGIVHIRVIEGQLEKITVEGIKHLQPSYIRDRLAPAVTIPVNVQKLEDRLRLLLSDPLIENVIPTLQAGSQEDQSVLTVKVKEAPQFTGNVGLDNLSPPSVGSERVGINLNYRNLSGIGDVLAGSYYRSLTGGLSIASFSYQTPLNDQDGSLQLRTDINRNRVTQFPFETLDITGASELYSITYRQPLWRSTREEFALSLGFDFQDGQTFLFNDLPTPFGIGPDQDGVSRTRVIKFAQDYLLRDRQGAWSLRSQFNLGTDFFNATNNPGNIPDGQFISWTGQIQRVQRISDGQLLIAQLDLQLTPDSLLPSQQFVLGGAQSVRGYRQNARIGDNGVRFSVENRIALQRDRSGTPTLQVAPFMDLGTVWNVGSNPNLLPRQNFLMGAGVGVLWQPIPQLNLRVDYGLPIVNLDDRGNNIQDDGLYFNLNYRF